MIHFINSFFQTRKVGRPLKAIYYTVVVHNFNLQEKTTSFQWATLNIHTSKTRKKSRAHKKQQATLSRDFLMTSNAFKCMEG